MRERDLIEEVARGVVGVAPPDELLVFALGERAKPTGTWMALLYEYKARLGFGSKSDSSAVEKCTRQGEFGVVSQTLEMRECECAVKAVAIWTRLPHKIVFLAQLLQRTNINQ